MLNSHLSDLWEAVLKLKAILFILIKLYTTACHLKKKWEENKGRTSQEEEEKRGDWSKLDVTQVRQAGACEREGPSLSEGLEHWVRWLSATEPGGSLFLTAISTQMTPRFIGRNSIGKVSVSFLSRNHQQISSFNMQTNGKDFFFLD